MTRDRADQGIADCWAMLLREFRFQSTIKVTGVMQHIKWS
jgi:hypothetical protein